MEASFFSSLLGDQAFAETSPNTVSLPKLGDNSQTITLLQANVSSFSILNDKDNNSVDINSSDNIVSGTSLSPATGPMGVLNKNDIVDSPFDQISVYVVRKGDSISAIADMFGVSTSTILWANDIKKGDKLSEGDTLIILPVSGVMHTILKGQTLKGIAKKYNVDALDIAGFNDIALDSPLTLGDELIIPDAEMVDIDVPKIKTNNKINNIKNNLKTLLGYFINPVPGYKRISQKIHGNNGVDLAAPTGTKILASASGTVLLARNGYNGGYGNMVIIKHPNGTQTLYAHQSKIATNTGDEVSQGEVIGYVGSTGRSTGPHLHYEVRGAKNNALDL